MRFRSIWRSAPKNRRKGIERRPGQVLPDREDHDLIATSVGTAAGRTRYRPFHADCNVIARRSSSLNSPTVCASLAGLLAQQRRGRRGLLDERRVLLRRIVEMRHRLIHLLDPGALLAWRRR